LSGQRIVGLISMDESFAERMELAGVEVPWEALVRHLDVPDRDASAESDQIVADIDRLVQDLAAEYAAITERI
jgi:hypothetical protein